MSPNGGPPAIIPMLKQIVALSLSILFLSTRSTGCPTNQTLYVYCACDRTEAGILVDCSGRDIALSTTILRDNTAQLGLIHELRLNNASVTQLPAGILHGLYIKKLDLSWNDIENIDERAFSGLENVLQSLSLSHNRLDRIPVAALDGMAALLNLDLSNNTIASVESSKDSLRNVPKLKDLNVANNKICKLHTSAFDSVKHSLQTLNLGSNCLDTVPAASLRGFKNLLALHLHENLIGAIEPLAFMNLPTLSLINLAKNQIISIHRQGFLNVPQLRLIYLTENSIQQLEPGQFLHFEKLEMLDLTGNKIGTIPSGAFSNMKSLAQLYLGDNLIGDIERDAFTNSSIVILLMPNNQLTELKEGVFEGAQSIQQMSFKSNRISKIAQNTFHPLANLVMLDLSNNLITDLAPATFLSQLNTFLIDLSYNRITRTPYNAFNKRIMTVALQENPLVCNERVHMLQNGVGLFVETSPDFVCGGNKQNVQQPDISGSGTRPELALGQIPRIPPKQQLFPPAQSSFVQESNSDENAQSSFTQNDNNSNPAKFGNLPVVDFGGLAPKSPNLGPEMSLEASLIQEGLNNAGTGLNGELANFQPNQNFPQNGNIQFGPNQAAQQNSQNPNLFPTGNLPQSSSRRPAPQLGQNWPYNRPAAGSEPANTNAPGQRQLWQTFNQNLPQDGQPFDGKLPDGQELPADFFTKFQPDTWAWPAGANVPQSTPQNGNPNLTPQNGNPNLTPQIQDPNLTPNNNFGPPLAPQWQGNGAGANGNFQPDQQQQQQWPGENAAARGFQQNSPTGGTHQQDQTNTIKRRPTTRRFDPDDPNRRLPAAVPFLVHRPLAPAGTAPAGFLQWANDFPNVTEPSAPNRQQFASTPQQKATLPPGVIVATDLNNAAPAAPVPETFGRQPPQVPYEYDQYGEGAGQLPQWTPPQFAGWDPETGDWIAPQPGADPGLPRAPFPENPTFNNQNQPLASANWAPPQSGAAGAQSSGASGNQLSLEPNAGTAYPPPVRANTGRVPPELQLNQQILENRQRQRNESAGKTTIPPATSTIAKATTTTTSTTTQPRLPSRTAAPATSAAAGGIREPSVTTQKEKDDWQRVSLGGETENRTPPPKKKPARGPGADVLIGEQFPYETSAAAAAAASNPGSGSSTSSATTTIVVCLTVVVVVMVAVFVTLCVVRHRSHTGSRRMASNSSSSSTGSAAARTSAYVAAQAAYTQGLYGSLVRPGTANAARPPAGRAAVPNPGGGNGTLPRAAGAPHTWIYTPGSYSSASNYYK